MIGLLLARLVLSSLLVSAGAFATTIVTSAPVTAAISVAVATIIISVVQHLFPTH